MDELTPRSRALLDRARAAREPTADDKARIQARLFAAVAAGAGAAAAGGAAGGAASGGGGAAGGAASGGGGAAGGGAAGGGAAGGAASGGASIGAAAASKGVVGGSVAGGAAAAGGVVSAGAGGALAAGGGGWVTGVVVALAVGGLAAGGAGLYLDQSSDPSAEGAEGQRLEGPSTARDDNPSPLEARGEQPVSETAPDERGGAHDGSSAAVRGGREIDGLGSGGAGRVGGAERRSGLSASDAPPPAVGVGPPGPGPTADRSGAGGVDDLGSALDDDVTIGRPPPGRVDRLRGGVGAPAGARRAGPARPRNAPPEADAHSDLGAQVALLRDADAELQAGQPARALALLRVHVHRFADSQLWAERDATRILALCALGRVDEARRRARDWMARAGASPLRASIRSSCAYR